ncbi:MAG: glycosyltransferase family 4 protein, partial [Burkholderiales bacterium]
AWELATHLASLPGVEPMIVAPLYINRYVAANNAVRIAGWRIAAIPRAGRLLCALTAPWARRSLERLAPDIVHETYYYSSAPTAPKGARSVVTLHDMIHERIGPTSAVIDRTSQAKRLAVSRADHVICVSESARRDLIELFNVEPARASVVHHGCWLPPEASATVNVSRRPYLLFVGQRGGYKNFEGLLHAYAATPALREDFGIVCFGGGRLTRHERAEIGRLGIAAGSVVQVSGADELLAGVYRRAAMLVYPSTYEGFGMPTVEAMAMGCPVACANAGSLPEICGDAAEYFDPANPQAIAAAMLRVLEAPGRSRALIARGFERATQFSWQTCAEKTAGIYASLL